MWSRVGDWCPGRIIVGDHRRWSCWASYPRSSHSMDSTYGGGTYQLIWRWCWPFDAGCTLPSTIGTIDVGRVLELEGVWLCDHVYDYMTIKINNSSLQGRACEGGGSSAGCHPTSPSATTWTSTPHSSSCWVRTHSGRITIYALGRCTWGRSEDAHNPLLPTTQSWSSWTHSILCYGGMYVDNQTMIYSPHAPD